jgi:hypothetical protein
MCTKGQCGHETLLAASGVCLKDWKAVMEVSRALVPKPSSSATNDALITDSKAFLST